MIQTSRLILKEPFEGEVDLIAPLQADARVMRFIGMGGARTREQVENSLEKNFAHWKAFGHGFWNVFEKESGEFIGRAGLLHLAYQHNHPEIEVGYLLHEKFWGKGYATELCIVLLDWGFTHLDVDHLIGVAYKENVASQNVMKKAGMKFDREDIYPRTNFMSLFYKIERL